MDNKAKFDQFEFEQLLLNCWGITSEIRLLNETYQDNPGTMSSDDIANYLQGLETIYDVKFQKLFDMFEAGCRNQFTSE